MTERRVLPEKRPEAAASKGIQFTGKKGWRFVIVPPEEPAEVGLDGLISGTEQLRLLARKARARDLNWEVFEQLIQTRNEAERLLRESQEAARRCERMLGNRPEPLPRTPDPAAPEETASSSNR